MPFVLGYFVDTFWSSMCHRMVENKSPKGVFLKFGCYKGFDKVSLDVLTDSQIEIFTLFFAP